MHTVPHKSKVEQSGAGWDRKVLYKRTRTCDPIDVNDVLYQLSHATMCFPTKVPVGTTD